MSPRPRPGKKPEATQPDAAPAAPARTNPDVSKSVGQPDEKSRAKAQSSHDRQQRHVEQVTATEGVPLNANGRPMHKITMTASELIPTGQYANVSVGPATITTYIDPDRVIETDDEGNAKPYFTTQEAETLSAAMNQIAEIIEIDVLAVQRNLVLESIQEQVAASTNGS